MARSSESPSLVFVLVSFPFTALILSLENKLWLHTPAETLPATRQCGQHWSPPPNRNLCQASPPPLGYRSNIIGVARQPVGVLQNRVFAVNAAWSP